MSEEQARASRRKHHRRSDEEPDRSPSIIRIEDVIAEPVDWLWSDRIPKGNITMIDGDPGQGKSWLTLAITSAVTRGMLLPGHKPEQPSEPANVLLLTAEDSPANTIRPRLEKLGAELSRVSILAGVHDRRGDESHLSLLSDIAVVEQAIVEQKCALVIIDPLNAYLGTELDTHKDAAMRSVLTPLARLAERHHVAVVCVRHLTKSKRDKAIYRGQGSIAYTAASRVAHLVGTYQGNERVMICIKNNLAPFPASVAFEITDGCLVWKGETDVSVESLLSTDASGEDRTTAQDKAEAFLRDALSKEPRPVKEVTEASMKANISERTLKRAKSALRIESWKIGGRDGFWMWALPTDTAKEAETKESSDRPSSKKKPDQAEKPEKAGDSPPSRVASFEPEPSASVPIALDNRGNDGFHQISVIDSPFLRKLIKAGQEQDDISSTASC